jgi:hypothetical protein
MKSLGLGLAYAVLFTAATQCSPVVNTSVSCSTNQGTASDNFACTMNGVGASAPGGSWASISASYTLLGNAFSVNSLGSVSATETFASPFSPYGASANSSASLAIDFTTSGPVRQGWVLITGSEGYAAAGVGLGSVASTSFSIGSSPLGGTAAASACTSLGHGSSNNNCDDVSGPQPIMLGTDIDFIGNVGASANSAVTLGTANAQAGFNATFQFFESDGTTPVMLLSDTQAGTFAPEPGTWGLFIVGLLGAFALRRQHRRLHSKSL